MTPADLGAARALAAPRRLPEANYREAARIMASVEEPTA